MWTRAAMFVVRAVSNLFVYSTSERGREAGGLGQIRLAACKQRARVCFK